MQINQENTKLEIGVEAGDSRVWLDLPIMLVFLFLLFLIAIFRTNIWVAIIFFGLLLLIGLAEAVYDRAYSLRLILDGHTRVITIDNPRHRWPRSYVKEEESFDTIESLSILASKKPERFHVVAKIESEDSSGTRDRILTRLSPCDDHPWKYDWPLKMELAQRMEKSVTDFLAKHGATSLKVEQNEV